MKRILTGAVLIALVGALIFVDIPWLITAFSAAVALLAAWEFRDLAVKAGAGFPRGWMVFALGLFFLTSALQPFDLLAAVSLSTLLLFTWSSFRSPLPRVLHETGAGLLTLLYIAYPLSLLPQILAAEDGTALLLFLFLCVWCGDIAALYVGRNFGKRRLAPTISPNKTWAGSVASVGGSVLFGMGLIAFGDWLTVRGSAFTRLHTSAPWWHYLLLAVVLNLAAQVGDLAESALKRGVEVKDSGTLLPGHGGVLDRIDALLFAAPVLWFVMTLHEVL